MKNQINGTSTFYVKSLGINNHDIDLVKPG